MGEYWTIRIPKISIPNFLKGFLTTAHAMIKTPFVLVLLITTYFYLAWVDTYRMVWGKNE